jgi:hypothetical protein
MLNNEQGMLNFEVLNSALNFNIRWSTLNIQNFKMLNNEHEMLNFEV